MEKCLRNATIVKRGSCIVLRLDWAWTGNLLKHFKRHSGENPNKGSRIILRLCLERQFEEEFKKDTVEKSQRNATSVKEGKLYYPLSRLLFLSLYGQRIITSSADNPHSLFYSYPQEFHSQAELATVAQTVLSFVQKERQMLLYKNYKGS